jgi:hypothetical protein
MNGYLKILYKSLNKLVTISTPIFAGLYLKSLLIVVGDFLSYSGLCDGGVFVMDISFGPLSSIIKILMCGELQIQESQSIYRKRLA